MHADDEGRETVTDWKLRPSIWPGDPISEDELVGHLLELHDAGYLGLYDANGRTYYQLREWPSVSHPKPSTHPEPPGDLFRRSSSERTAGRSAWEREGAGEREG
ncbi:MAG: hypothetical protein IE935_11630, partial [Micrococcales bacterium]|nr:hypothetical protein [Micrococcales bacterium]